MRGDPLFREGVELLQRTPPTAAPAELKLRVWHALRRADSAAAARGLRSLLLKVAVAGAVALVAGTAGAVITHRWIAPRLNHAAEPAAPNARAPRRPAAPRAEKVSAPEVAIPVEASTADARPARSSPRPAAKKIASAAPTVASVARERSEVLDALIALRREHDAVRAGTLLARYLSAHPHGALREEALVLAIEAADARGDRAAGDQLARAYQDEFPAGRFSAFARSHTDRDGARQKDPTH
jgi:hypothetical protein